MERIGGIISLEIDGVLHNCKGAFTVEPGVPTQETVVGSSGIAGIKRTPKPAAIEGALTKGSSLDVKALASLINATAVLTFDDGQRFVLHEAAYVGECTVGTEEGEVSLRLEGEYGEFF